MKNQQTKDLMLKWFNKNRRQLLKLYPNQYVAYNENGIIGHSENLQEILKIVEEAGLKDHYCVYLVPRNSRYIQILPFYFRSVTREQWQPNYTVILKNKDIEIETPILVDSGAELSLISFKMGQDLGLALADNEYKFTAETIGGVVEYVIRNLEIKIDEHLLIAPFAWLQNPINVDQLLLGREVVFDLFNIEFRQADEQIIFTWRKA